MFIMIRISESEMTPMDQDSAGPSDLPSFSDTLRSRLQSASMKYSPTPLELMAHEPQACVYLTCGHS